MLPHPSVEGRYTWFISCVSYCIVGHFESFTSSWLLILLSTVWYFCFCLLFLTVLLVFLSPLYTGFLLLIYWHFQLFICRLFSFFCSMFRTVFGVLSHLNHIYFSSWTVNDDEYVMMMKWNKYVLSLLCCLYACFRCVIRVVLHDAFEFWEEYCVDEIVVIIFYSFHRNAKRTVAVWMRKSRFSSAEEKISVATTWKRCVKLFVIQIC